ncbi:MAG: peptidylprolyl isomerase [Candidatus Aenigmarchaeota archaeon]|nr:peptidylprolyl isomerase [Candidatus Aenigmarchaeota archaeon]
MQKGDFIKVNYIGKLESGEIFDLTEAEVAKKEKVYSEKIHYGPVPVILGEGFLVKGLENELEHMNVGDRKSVKVHPKDGFGERNPTLIKVVNEKEFEKQNLTPKPGMIVDFGGIKGRIQSTAGGRVTIDFNNPLSGKVLDYEIEVVEKVENTEDQIKSILEFYGIAPHAAVEGSAAKITAVIQSQQMRGRIADLVLKHIKGIEKIDFIETYTKDHQKAHEKTHDKKHAEAE